MPSSDNRSTPYHAFHFVIEIDGIQRAGFRECSGLEGKSQVILYRDGNDPPTMRKLPGLSSYSDLVLKWGVCDDTDLWKWRKKTIDGKTERKNGSIVLLDESGQEKVRWNFKMAWPSDWSGPALNAAATDVAIEQLTLSHEGIERQ